VIVVTAAGAASAKTMSPAGRSLYFICFLRFA
jgi:hypothetical protein